MSNQNPTENTRSLRREKAASDALRSFIRDILQEKFPLREPDEIDLPLNLSLHIHCGEAGELRFDPDLRSQVIEQAEAWLKPREVFQEGSVYDFHEKRPQRPPNALAVFAGYDPMGHPKWSDVSEILADEMIQKIFSGKELKTEQLQAYGKNDKAYNILGQLVLGPLPVPPAYRQLTGSPSFALTVQIVETRTSRAHFALELNLIVGGLLPEELDEMLQELPLRVINQTVLALQENIHDLEQRALSAWTREDTRAFNRELKIIPALLSKVSAKLAGHPFGINR